LTAVTVSSVFARKFTVTNDALETQCLYDGRTGWHVAAREAQVVEVQVQVTEKQPELEECVSLKVHQKVPRKALRQDRHPGPL
jgi:hypothetical protein